MVLPITGRVCAIALELRSAYPNDPADWIIGATALAQGLSLLTADREIRKSKFCFHDLEEVSITQARLGGQIVAFYRIATEQQLVNRIAGQTRGIVGIGIVAGDREHALRQHLFQRVIDFAGLPLILQTGSQASD